MGEIVTTSNAITKFLLNTTLLCPTPRHYALRALRYCADIITINCKEVQPVSTGSNAEFYIEPLLSCVGDRDVMYFDVSQLAIPKGYAPPSQLPPEFHSFIYVTEIIDSGYAGYAFLILSHFLIEADDEGGTFKPFHCASKFYISHNEIPRCPPEENVAKHGPAMSFQAYAPFLKMGQITEDFSLDYVYCMRCSVWPPQADLWPSRLRKHVWPEAAVIDYVVNVGCDLVPIAHPLCRHDEWMGTHQWRLSFSRAETVLLNSWTPVKQIVYHLLRVFMKTERVTERANKCEGNSLSNYHIKTLLLWAAELKPPSWWNDDVNFVRICVELLHTLSTQMTDSCSRHYFLNSCNLFPVHRSSDDFAVAAALLGSWTEASFAQWFVDSYIKRCCDQIPEFKKMAPMFHNISSAVELNVALSALVSCRVRCLPIRMFSSFDCDQRVITCYIGRWIFRIRSVVYFILQQKVIDHRLFVYAAASIFLHAAYEIQKSGVRGDFHKYVEVLMAVIECFYQSSTSVVTDSMRRFVSRNLLQKATKMLKLLASKSLESMELVGIELAKAYLYKILNCKDSDSHSIYCLANVYLAVLHYIIGQYQTAMDHCARVTVSRDHLQCSSHTVQGDVLPKIDDNVDNILGLAVFYQYVLSAVLDQHQTHPCVFAAELFAHYFVIRCCFASKFVENIFHNTSLRNVLQQYVTTSSPADLGISDVLLLKTVLKQKLQEGLKATAVDTHCARSFEAIGRTGSKSVQNTSRLVDLLKQSAIELLTSFRLQVREDFGPYFTPVTSDFEALYAFHQCQYRRCIRLSKDIVNTLLARQTWQTHIGLRVNVLKPFMFPEFMQMMDDDIVSLFGLVLLFRPTVRDDGLPETIRLTAISQLALALYLLVQSQIKLTCCPVGVMFDTDLDVSITQVITEQFAASHVLELLVLKLTKRKFEMYRKDCLLRMTPFSEYDQQSFDEFAQFAKTVARYSSR